MHILKILFTVSLSLLMGVPLYGATLSPEEATLEDLGVHKYRFTPDSSEAVLLIDVEWTKGRKEVWKYTNILTGEFRDDATVLFGDSPWDDKVFLRICGRRFDIDPAYLTNLAVGHSSLTVGFGFHDDPPDVIQISARSVTPEEAMALFPNADLASKRGHDYMKVIDHSHSAVEAKP